MRVFISKDGEVTTMGRYGVSAVIVMLGILGMILISQSIQRRAMKDEPDV